MPVDVVTRSSPLQRSVSQARKAVRDALLVVAALALLGAQALSTLHFVLVPHHLCSVHGVLEDGGHTKARAHAAQSERRDAVVDADAADNDLHEACSVATRSEHGVLPERPAAEPLEPLHVARVAVNQGVLLRTDRTALLSNAPKTSPPSA